MQNYSSGDEESSDAYYYEREWRIGELNMYRVGSDRSQWIQAEKLNPSAARMIVENNKKYFEFCDEDVAFLIVPRKYVGKVANPNKYEEKVFEDLVD